MADRNPPAALPARLAPLAARLAAGRLLIAVLAAALLVLAIAGLVSWTGAGLILVALIAAMALLPAEGLPAAAGTALAGPQQEALPPATRRIVEALPDATFILDRSGTVRYANDRAAAAFSIRQGEVLTTRLRHPELVAAFDRVCAGGPGEQASFSERVPTERTFSAWFAPLGGSAAAGGLPELILLILADLTAARAAERMRVDFVANASHELRTPLASLAGFIETLQGPARDDAAARARFLAIMHEQATRMSRLIDDLLSLSRIEMKAHLRPRDPVDLMALLRHVAAALERVAADNGVAIELDLAAAATVPGDRDELVQVFENLVENACKYGGPGGRVLVRLAGAPPRGPVTVSVTDFGPGIPPEHLPRLTERFYRIDGDDMRRHRGTGLGLAIVKHIVARHRARLTIASPPGEGATFSVTFPEATVRDLEPVPEPAS
jgi:two-component system phosphate regulon sensor histidine kinase PhoR